MLLGDQVLYTISEKILWCLDYSSLSFTLPSRMIWRPFTNLRPFKLTCIINLTYIHESIVQSTGICQNVLIAILMFKAWYCTRDTEAHLLFSHICVLYIHTYIAHICIIIITVQYCHDMIELPLKVCYSYPSSNSKKILSEPIWP